MSAIAFSEPSSSVPQGINANNAYLNSRNTFYWDATAHAKYPGDYTQAKLQHWTHSQVNTSLTADFLESRKNPLESRVWFNYPGQGYGGGYGGTCQKPTKVARVLPDGTTQLTQMEYNDFGKLTKRTDPKGRETQYEYAANGIDLLRVKQKTSSGDDLLLEMTWNDQHRPLTIRDAAGQVSRYTYNAAGQLLTATTPTGETTKYRYDSLGRLTEAINPNGRTQAKYAYDRYGNLAQETDSEGYALKYEYDALNRRTRTRYPDGSAESYVWNRLDVSKVRARDGKTTSYVYDAARRLTSVTDPGQRTVRYGYQENGLLASITDAKGNTTRWERDVQGRITAKIYPDGSREEQAYDTAGRLIARTDAAGKTETRSYGLDNRLTKVGYPNGTPGVELTDDPYYPRLSRHQDGLGTTIYRYVPIGNMGAGQLQKIDGPFNNDELAFTYDAQGRVIQRDIGDKSERFSYDKLGRIKSHQTPLGNFSFNYLGQTNQETQQRMGLGGLIIDRYYEQNQKDRMLKAVVPWSLTHLPGSGAATHLYDNDARSGEIEAHGELPGRVERYRYDDSERLTKAELRPWALEWKEWLLHLPPGSTTALAVLLTQHGKLKDAIQVWNYDLDAADNLTRVKTPEGQWTGEPNELNQYRTAKNQAWTYDLAGNLVDDGQRTFVWDGANRLVRITDKKTGQISEFQYDGNSRLTVKREYEKAGATPTETRYLWCDDTTICQKRDQNDKTLATYFQEGEQQGKTSLFYVQDHLGSVTDVTDARGRLIGKLNYSAYGEQTKVAGQLPDRRYAGMFYDKSTNLYLTHYRFYDADAGRWLNRDPIGETGGLNLYGYVGGNPLIYTDPTGTLKLPNDPTGLPNDWQRDPRHQDPNGERWLHPSGDVLDWHKGRAGLPGWRGKDHWHHNGGEEHLPPGSDIPDPSPADEDEACGDDCQQKVATVVSTGAGLYIIYRCLRMIPSLFPPLWSTIPVNAATP